MRRLVLHIGAHKTGSTALQLGLQRNRERLAECGAAYVTYPDAAHLHGFLGFSSWKKLCPDGFHAHDTEALAGHLASADQDLVIASSENFSFFFQRPAIEALGAALRPHFDDIRIVSYLRRQDRHAISHHQEGAKAHRQAEAQLWGHALTALPEASPEQALYLDYERRLGLWADVFGADHLDLRVYDRSLLLEGDILADFLALTGLQVSGMIPVGDRNVSLGAAQCKAGHLMNALAVRPKTMATILNRIAPVGRLLPSEAAARAFLEPYRSANQRLNARFSLSAYPDLFNDDFADYPETAQDGWTDRGATAALRAVLEEITGADPDAGRPTADDLRLAAGALKHKNPDAALRLIGAAEALRPGGPAIQRLKAELEHRLKT